MTWQSSYLLHLNIPVDYYWFVFFATLCSYNFHWYLTPPGSYDHLQVSTGPFSIKAPTCYFTLSVSSGSLIFFYKLREHWFALFFATLLTFLYSAPKIPLPYFRFLKQVAIGKTIFLTTVWTYVTAILPVFVSGLLHHYQS